jgi:hypothetical protein
MRISDSRIKIPWSYPPSPILSRIYYHVQSFSLPPYNFFPFFRRSAPRAHWPELSLAEAAHRATLLHNSTPSLANLPTLFTNILP